MCVFECVVTLRVVDWDIDDVVDVHQLQKSKRIEAVARVLKRKCRVNREKFLAEMQFNGLRKQVAVEYIEVLKTLGKVRIEGGDIVWVFEREHPSKLPDDSEIIVEPEDEASKDR